MTNFYVRGAGAGKIVERARSRGVPLFSVHVSEEGLAFCTKRAFTPTMIAILENMCYHKRDVKPSELGKKDFCVQNFASPRAILSRAALALFAVFFVLSCLFVNGRVLEIEIQSDNPSLVAALLDDYGIKRGGKVQDIKDVEHYLNRKLDARYVFVRQQGIKLSVEVWAREGQPLEIVQDSIYAPRDGVVQSVILLSGTAKVKPGDEVKEGDLLIEGKITSENGGEITCRAAGQIFLECEEQKTFLYDTVRRSPFRTGKRASYTQLVFPFGTYGKTVNPFSEYETVVSETAAGGMFPVIVRRVEVFELGYLEEKIDFEKIREIVIAEKIAQAVEESENEVLSSRAEVSGEEQKTITVTLTTLVKCGGAIGNQNI